VFDTWDTTGTRAADVDRFTADDLVAVTVLSVDVNPSAAHAFLRVRADAFSDLPTALGPDRDLADEVAPLSNSWAGWTLMRELEALPGVGSTIASKLLARKRPRLRPIYDSVVATVTDTPCTTLGAASGCTPRQRSRTTPTPATP
jgi:Family of unknown function (DUF6308)